MFLDRDGVINAFPGKGLYVIRPEAFRLIPEAVEGIRLLTEAGYELHVVSNQGCVSRGLITPKELEDLTGGMLKDIAAAGGRIAGVHYCMHQTSDGCDCRKPKTALFIRALNGRRVDPERVAFIGDSEEDMLAGHSLGCRKVLVLSGRLKKSDVQNLPVKPDAVKRDLLEAAKWLLAEKH